MPSDDFRRVVQGRDALTDVDGERRAEGAVINEIPDRFTDAEFHADWDECKARHGENTDVFQSLA